MFLLPFHFSLLADTSSKNEYVLCFFLKRMMLIVYGLLILCDIEVVSFLCPVDMGL